MFRDGSLGSKFCAGYENSSCILGLPETVRRHGWASLPAQRPANPYATAVGDDNRGARRTRCADEDRVRYHGSREKHAIPKPDSGESGNQGASAGTRESFVADQLKQSAQDQQKARVKLWAFCVSPHGLGMSDIDFWCSSYQEINALKSVYDQSIWRWAHQQAALYNANTRFDMQGVPWSAEDFLGRGDRASRVAKVIQDAERKQKDDRAVEFLNFKLDLIRKNKSGKDIPFWAMDTWTGEIPEGAHKYDGTIAERERAKAYGR